MIQVLSIFFTEIFRRVCEHKFHFILSFIQTLIIVMAVWVTISVTNREDSKLKLSQRLFHDTHDKHQGKFIENLFYCPCIVATRWITRSLVQLPEFARVALPSPSCVWKLDHREIRETPARMYFDSKAR